MIRLLALALLTSTVCSAAPLKVLTIGDSLTDEYGSIAELVKKYSGLSGSLVPDVYPEPDSPSTNPRAFNWPELLAIKRSQQITFGPYRDDWGGINIIFPFGDLRLIGYQYNFAVVGTTTTNWVNLIQNPPVADDFAGATFYPKTRTSLLATLPVADVVVIMLGGNDLKNVYASLFNDTEPAGFLDDLRGRLDAIHAFVRSNRPGVPIIVATVPDVLATPDVHDTYNVPAMQTTTRAKIAAMNDQIVSQFSAKPSTAVARIDRLTSDILDILLGLTPGPFDLNGTEFVIGGDPFNPPEYLFCKDDFHPHTVAQALIANEIIHALNQLVPDAATPFSHREILDELLQLDPDQPYLDWIASYPLAADGPDDDPDGDGLPNLVEMILGTPPDRFSSPFTGSWPGGISWTPVETRFATLVAEESGDLDAWDPVPPERLSTSGDETTATPPPGQDHHFLRFRAVPRP